jgi:DNA-binding beta-propeller fold protein YncE
MVGPPQSVAVAGDPADPTKLAPNDALTVIDPQVSPPAVIAHLAAGLGASGVSINPAGNLALVANRVEGTVSAFTIEGKKVRSASKLDLGNPKAGPCHIVFTADGSTGLLTRERDNKISPASTCLPVCGPTALTSRQQVALPWWPTSDRVPGMPIP